MKNTNKTEKTKKLLGFFLLILIISFVFSASVVFAEEEEETSFWVGSMATGGIIGGGIATIPLIAAYFGAGPAVGIGAGAAAAAFGVGIIPAAGGGIVAYGGILALRALSGVTAQDFSKWYAVEDWEIEACSRVVIEEKKGDNQYESSDIPDSSEDPIITLSAYKTKFADNTFEYEIAWFVQPTKEDITYDIVLYNDDLQKIISKAGGTTEFSVKVGTESSQTAISAGYALYPPEGQDETGDFTRVKLRYWKTSVGQSSIEQWDEPIIDITAER